MMPIDTTAKSAEFMEIFTHYPRHARNDAHANPVDPAGCEEVLTEWFGHPVILLSSGRAGINIVLKALGMHQYKSRLRVPNYLSTCVLNVVTPFAFPVDITQNGDGVLWYHQYGFRQRSVPVFQNIIEDCAHSFFSSPFTGERDWASDVAIFSLPKFFSIAGMAGGIIVRNPELEARLRSYVVESPADIPEVRSWMREIISSAFNVGVHLPNKLFIGSAYELLTQFIRPDPFDLAGFPSSIDEIRLIGQRRRERVGLVVDYFGRDSFPEPMICEHEQTVPFAMPCFEISDEKKCEKVNNLLIDIGVHAGTYRFDIRCDCSSPEYRTCILLPCHQNMPLVKLEEACRIIASCGAA